MIRGCYLSLLNFILKSNTMNNYFIRYNNNSNKSYSQIIELLPISIIKAYLEIYDINYFYLIQNFVCKFDAKLNIKFHKLFYLLSYFLWIKN